MNVEINIGRNCRIWETAMDFQKRLAEIVESMTAFNVVEVNVEVRGIEN